jgi:hypothetical protein
MKASHSGGIGRYKMGRFVENIIGRRFGRLLVVEKTDKRQGRNVVWKCVCDCGNVTYQRTNTLKMGLTISCGCFMRESVRKRMTGSSNPMWRGNFASLGALHTWVRNRKPRPYLCEKCGENTTHDLANISGKYFRKLDDYEWLCRKCHMKSDGRIDSRKENGQFERVRISPPGINK